VLRIDGGGLEFTRRGTQVAKRALSADEAGKLKALVDGAQGAEPVKGTPGRLRDAFNYSVTVDGELKAQLTAPHAPEATEGPWQALTAWLDELLAAEIQRAP
jgi:hypothetical protein